MQSSADITRDRRPTIYLLYQIGGWGTYAAIGWVLYATADPRVRLHWIRSSAALACSGLLGGVTSHLYRLFIRRRGWLKLSFGKVLLRVLIASPLLGAVTVAEVAVAWKLIGFASFRPLTWVLPAVVSWTWAVLFWNLLYFGVHYFEAYRAAQVEKLQLTVVAKEAQLQRLAAQLNPHFMFNCLNSVRALILEDPMRARDMVTGLSELLRYSLQSGNSPTVPLSTEMEIVQTYLKLEAMRFEERLIIHLDPAPETLNVRVPAMLVQSLVENGVKHGIEKLPQGGEIRVSSELKNGSLHIQVVSSGQLGPSGNSTGIGLANARERLRLLYGKDAELALENRGSDSVQADISIPVTAEKP